MAHILVVDPDQATCRWLESALERDGFTVEIVHRGEDALKRIAQEPPKVLVLEVALEDMDGIELIRRVRSDPSMSGIGIVVLSKKMKISDLQAGLDAGADEYLAKRPGVDVELGSKIRTLAERQPIQAASPASRGNGKSHQGKIISFCSATGGSGTTSVCVNAAYALARLQARSEVCVVDMVMPLGMIGRSVGYESPQTIARLTQTLNGNMTPETVKVFISAEADYGLHVLLGANNLKEASALNSSKLGGLFETLRHMYDYIFIDFGRDLSCTTLPIIETSDAVALVLTPDPSSVKMTKLVLQHMESLRVPRHRIAPVNNHVIGRSWMSTEEIENELGLALAVSIPHELEYIAMAFQSGIPFMAKYPERSASKVFTEFARTLVDRIPNS